MKAAIYFLLPALLCLSCNQPSEHTTGEEEKLFTRLSADQTNINFINQLQETAEFDVFRYRNYYNGGGVAIGDINNDGLPDIYLTANRKKNRLYLNKGNFTFEDITEKAMVQGIKPWSTGVSLADINADGLLDIYVCNSGDIDGNNMENELFINNGDLSFTEKAADFGLADPGYSTHAVFFDYDKDGDLDCYLLNNSFRPISTLGYKNLRDQRDEKGGDKLFKNENGKFIDVSAGAGIFGSVIGFGLGISIGDVNGDNYPDIFISNDFYERDYLYINQQNGRFKECLPQWMDHISMFSMGADIADINHDGLPEIFTTDMLPESDRRLKTMTAFETYDVHQLRLKNDYYYQYMRNTLQLNQEGKRFSEIGYLANVAATDWSWGALISDFDNNGEKDIFVSNGIYKDVTNQDFIEYLANDENMRAAIEGEKVDFQDFIDRMPSEKLSNYMFSQTTPLRFENTAESWGLDEPSFSNGAAYGDLDGDGDLDLVVNNVNQELFIYRNNTERHFSDHHHIAFHFKGEEQNPFGLGAKVNLYTQGNIISADHMPIRGFQSSMDYKMVIGLGKSPAIDSIMVTWPDGKKQCLQGLQTDTTHLLDYQEAHHGSLSTQPRAESAFEAIKDSGIRFSHKENDHNDFDKERMVYQMLSTEGPAFDAIDLDGDGLEDFYIGGAIGQAGRIYRQNHNGQFSEIIQEAFNRNAASEDVAALFFDANGDHKPDLLVVSGGSEFRSNSPELNDRLYINRSSNGLIKFELAEKALPRDFSIGSTALAHDINGDGHLDLFIGSRKSNTYYGPKPQHRILINDGKGTFTDRTSQVMPALSDIGMITDAAWADTGNDGIAELIIIGDWEPIRCFSLSNGSIKEIPLTFSGMEKSSGWWKKIHDADLNGDGLSDLILGNAGLNQRFIPSEENPISLYVHDFDNNGSVEPIHAYSIDKKDVPVHTRHELARQMSSIKKKFQNYKSYAGKNMAEVFGEQNLDKALVLRSHQAETMVLINQGNGHFIKKELPLEAQFTQIRAIETMDVNRDGNMDILLAGNFYAVKPALGRYDASDGLVLLGDRQGNFSHLPSSYSGFSIPGQTRHLRHLQTDQGNYLLAVRNNASLLLFKQR